MHIKSQNRIMVSALGFRTIKEGRKRSSAIRNRCQSGDLAGWVNWKQAAVTENAGAALLNGEASNNVSMAETSFNFFLNFGFPFLH